MAEDAIGPSAAGKPRNLADQDLLSQHVMPQDCSDDYGSIDDDSSGYVSSHVSSSPLKRAPTTEREFILNPDALKSSPASQHGEECSASTYHSSMPQSSGIDHLGLESVVHNYETERTTKQSIPEYFTEEFLAEQARRTASFPSRAFQTEPELNGIRARNHQNHGSRSPPDHHVVRFFPWPRRRVGRFRGPPRVLCRFFKAGFCRHGQNCTHLHPGINGPI